MTEKKAAIAQVWGDIDAFLTAGVDTLPKLLRYQTSRFPDQVLHRRKDYGIWQRYTWSDVLGQVRSFAMGMLEIGVCRGDTVALIGENEPQLFWGQYAANCIGAKVVCIFPDLTTEQLEFILQHSRAVMVICEDQEQVDKALELEKKLPLVKNIVYWDPRGMWQYHNTKLNSFEEIQTIGKTRDARDPQEFDRAIDAGLPGDVAVLSYTSGTSGLPKACILTNQYMIEVPVRLAGAVNFKRFTQYLSYISPAWATEQIFGVALGLIIPLVVNFPEEPETVQQNIREIGAQALVLSPRQWESLATLVEAKMMDAGAVRRKVFESLLAVGRRVNLTRLEGNEVSIPWRLLYRFADIVLLRHLREDLGLQSVTIAVSGGSGMAPEAFRFFHAMGVPLRNIYGTTEVGLLTLHQGNAYDLETVGSWLPVNPKLGVPIQYRVSKEGELQVSGGIGFAGYYENLDATAEKEVDGWYRTGDAVHLANDDSVIYLERISDMRELSDGHRYPPQFIEGRLRFNPYIKDVMTLGGVDRAYVGAFVNIDSQTLGRWAEQHGVTYTTFADLSQNETIRELIREQIAEVNKLLPKGSRVLRFVNLPKELDPDEGELTRTRKLRRSFLEKKYAPFIEAIYTQAIHQFNATIPVKYQDGRSSVMSSIVYVNEFDHPIGKTERGPSVTKDLQIIIAET